MGRLLLIIFAGIIIYWLIKSLVRSLRRPSATQHPSEDMIACALCGLNVLRSESILSQDKAFCCDEHRRQFSQK